MAANLYQIVWTKCREHEDGASRMSSKKPESGSLRAPGLFSRPNRYIQWNKTACLVSAVLACLFVALVAGGVVFIVSILEILTEDRISLEHSEFGSTPFGGGVVVAIFACIFNFYFSPIIVPATWFILSQTIGRLAHRGISSKWAYMRWTAFWGAFLVGSVCALPVFLGLDRDILSNANNLPQRSETIQFFLGCVLTGGTVGAVAGTLVGAMFVLIVRPAKQLKHLQKDAIEVF